MTTHFQFPLLWNQQKSGTKTLSNRSEAVPITAFSLEVGISLNRSVQRLILSTPSKPDLRQLNKAFIIKPNHNEMHGDFYSAVPQQLSVLHRPNF